LYNRYVRDENGSYHRISTSDDAIHYFSDAPPVKETFFQADNSAHSNVPSEPSPKQGSSAPKRAPEIKYANRLLQHINIKDIDSGDLLLLALLFFLIRQNADEELVIALGLLLIL